MALRAARRVVSAVRVVRHADVHAQPAEQVLASRTASGPAVPSDVASSTNLTARVSGRERGCGKRSSDATPLHRSAMLALIAALAAFAADLWFVGKLDHFPVEQQPVDDD